MKGYNQGLVDTNLLVMAVREKALEHKQAKRFIKRLAKEKKIVLTPQILLEFYNVMLGLKFTSSQALKSLEYFMNISGLKMIFPKENSYRSALKLGKKYQLGGKARIFDAYLAATAIENKVKVIYTQNTRDFVKFRAVKAVNPL